MGSGVWFKNIISKKKVKGDKSHKVKTKYTSPETADSYKEYLCSEKETPKLVKAATRIQTAYRAYRARKTLRRMRGIVRLQNLLQCDSVKKQGPATLSHLHSWSKIQSQIRTRRVHMVTEGRLRQKKMENQLKLEAKLHGLEVDWSGGSETIGEALAKIHHREEAAGRRERAMAYAFSHQWRANSNPNFGSTNHEISKEDWGWSWMDRWIVARPWETRAPSLLPSPNKAKSFQTKKTNKNTISPTSKTPTKDKLNSPNGKAATTKPRRLSYEATEKTAARKMNLKAEDKSKNEQERS